MSRTESKRSPLLEVENVKKYYPVKGGVITHKIGDVKAVDGVSFTMYQGETLGLVGESGCGKSTLGRQIVALERPTSGKILYGGSDLTAISSKQMRPIRTKLQMVFQDSYSSLNPRKHIYEILSEPMLYHGIATRATLDKELARLLDMVGLPSSALGRYPHEFSGGQRQRIGIARAISLKPELMVCDEPVSALDVSIQAQILNLLRDLQRELDLTCLFIGHGLGAVNYVSDRIAVMYLGRIVELAEAKELFTNPVHPYSKALFRAVPIPDPRAREEEIPLLQGEIASNTNPPAGCRFHPRCPYAQPFCSQAEPELKSLSPGSGHLVACPVLAGDGTADAATSEAAAWAATPATSEAAAWAGNGAASPAAAPAAPTNKKES